MTFVDDQVTQAAQEDCPSGVVAQQRQVDHVGVGEDPARPLPRETTHLGGAVAVVGRRRDVTQPGDRRSQRVRCAQLVVAKRFRGRDVERPGTWIGRQRIEDGKLVGQRLTRCRASADYYVAPGVGQVCSLNLM